MENFFDLPQHTAEIQFCYVTARNQTLATYRRAEGRVSMCLIPILSRTQLYQQRHLQLGDSAHQLGQHFLDQM